MRGLTASHLDAATNTTEVWVMAVSLRRTGGCVPVMWQVEAELRTNHAQHLTPTMLVATGPKCSAACYKRREERAGHVEDVVDLLVGQDDDDGALFG